MTPISFSPWDMFLNAGPVVRCVMILLAVASLLTWTIFIAKSVELLRVRMKLTKAEQTLEQANTLDLGEEWSRVISGACRPSPPADRWCGLAHRATAARWPGSIGYASSASLALELAPGVSLSQAQSVIDQEWRNLHLPETINGELQSDEGDVGRSTHDSEILIVGAVLAVYLTLGMLYESVWHPLTILSTIPSAGIGAVIALDLFGLPFSGMAVIAMLLLTGISLKNAILLVDFAIHAERERGMTPRDAIRKACLLRLRPIVMTTFAAALGALPLVLMGGYGMELRQPLGIALIGGLLVSQGQTMFTTPALYLLVEKAAAFLSSIRTKRPARKHS
ncbi:efflux RND transporter permease subunit [Novacetimonas hansenii]|uniref:Efflux RND transporter permease subunit n=1 Tax=Novacetimonas hansenii TaxID=436 RepID=A0AAW5ETD3_NOVHA|nr:efflux RND transporter permease subunit [Novacetimonas hansenii]MCJ8354590.1 efflux RND transporter permease subunit [Novacetimonas hansenii]